jgi:glutaminyl-tRNA synthetase
MQATSFQFLRLGYFSLDTIDSRPDRLVFNRSVSLKDSYKPAEASDVQPVHP